jgi:CheY-like chemotaxis protein
MSAPSPVGPPAQRAARVLVVDDDALSCSVLSQMLRLLGLEAQTEASARRAVERARAEPFDLLMIDLSMPEIDGFELLRQVRAGRAGAPPAIAFSGRAGGDDRDRCASAGFSALVPKPVQLAKLQPAIEETLGTSAPGVIGTMQPRETTDAERLQAAALRLERTTPEQERFAPTAVEGFALRSAQAIDALRRAIDTHATAAAVLQAQLLDASARFLGARQLASCAAEVGARCADGQWAQARRQLREFEAQHQAVLAVLLRIDR